MDWQDINIYDMISKTMLKAAIVKWSIFTKFANLNFKFK